MDQSISYHEHWVRVNVLDRERFGYVKQMKDTGIAFMESKQFLFEVMDEQTRMPSALIETANVIWDYGRADTFEAAENSMYLPWVRRVVQCGAENGVTIFRAALIACGEMTLDAPDSELFSQLQAGQKEFGVDAEAWSDDAIQVAIQLSLNEEVRSLKEIAKRAEISRLIAEQLNAGQVEAEQSEGVD
jgi:hypothetical protein